MPDPLFNSRTPRLELPLLFAGQTQKEGYLNETAARLDALLFLAIEGEATSPPTLAADGQSWLVGPAATGEWAGESGQIAVRQGGNWLFATPVDGLRLLHRASGQEWRYAGGWRVPDRPALPSGGGTIDAEARLAIAGILTALTVAGLIPAA
ncbi:MAG: DUF2793 domain-containing protein [Sphingomonadaceae bacterium]|nr:DUF2793 domain-containing protein [Sphingomonadaceae bacterium]